MQNLQNFRKDLAIFLDDFLHCRSSKNVFLHCRSCKNLFHEWFFNFLCYSREEPTLSRLRQFGLNFSIKIRNRRNPLTFRTKIWIFFSKQNISKIKFNGELIKGDSRVDFGRLSSRSMQSSPNKFGPLAKQKDSIWPNGRQSRKSTGLVRNQLAEKQTGRRLWAHRSKSTCDNSLTVLGHPFDTVTAKRFSATLRKDDSS